MRIAHIVCTYPPYFGGMGNVAFAMANELGALGHEVAVFTPQYFLPEEIKSPDAPSAAHTEELTEQIATVRRLAPSLRYGNAAHLPQLGKELDEFDLVHLHYPFFGTANLVRKWKLRHPDRPLVITYHMDTRGPGWKGLFFKYYSAYWMPKILGAADQLTVSSFEYLSHSDAQMLYAREPKKWVELPFGVDLDRFVPGTPDPALVKAWGLNPELPAVLFVGGMDEAHYFKGIPVLLSAVALAKKQDVPLQVVLVGDGRLRTQYEQTATGLGIADRTRFVGRLSDEELPYAYQLADLLVLPSLNRGEAFGMVLLEAFASGVPVVATDIPGVRQVARAAGQVVPPNDPEALANAMMGFFLGDTDIPTWRRAARTAAEETYNWTAIVKKLDVLYRSLTA